MNAKMTNGLVIVGTVAVLALTVYLSHSTGIPWRELDAGSVGSLLVKFFLVALLLERALEVIITTWRGPGAADLEAPVAELESELRVIREDTRRDQAARDAAAEPLLANLRAAQSALRAYRAVTQRWALWSAFVIGVALSGSGLRFLDPLLASPAAEEPRGLLRFLDVLLSGATLAGGSEGIHKIIQAFMDVAEATGAKAKVAATR